MVKLLSAPKLKPYYGSGGGHENRSAFLVVKKIEKILGFSSVPRVSTEHSFPQIHFTAWGHPGGVINSMTMRSMIGATTEGSTP